MRTVASIDWSLAARVAVGILRASGCGSMPDRLPSPPTTFSRSEEHTSELQSPCNLVCRLLLEPHRPPLPPHSLPTRRSSDLEALSDPDSTREGSKNPDCHPRDAHGCKHRLESCGTRSRGYTPRVGLRLDAG